MKISILIAANHTAEIVAGALESVRRQTEVEWEVILVEYGPSATAEAVAREFAESAQKPMHHEKVRGLNRAGARNRLLELATSDIVAFLEPTDSWEPRHLSNAMEKLWADVDLVISDVRLLDAKTRHPFGEVKPAPRLFNNPARALFTSDAISSASAVVLRRHCAARVGGFDAAFSALELRDFWLRCAMANLHFVSTEQVTCECPKPAKSSPARALLLGEEIALFYEKHRDIPQVPAALRRRLLAASLASHGRVLRASDPARAALCFARAWSLQPVHVQTLGEFALSGGGFATDHLPPPIVPPLPTNETADSGR